MIELLTANTPNGKKISIMLEEIRFEYKVTKVNIQKDEQFDRIIIWCKISMANLNTCGFSFFNHVQKYDFWSCKNGGSGIQINP